MQILGALLRGRNRRGCSPLAALGLGLLCLVAGVVLLWINEGRVDFGRIGATGEAVTADALPTVPDGTFVAASGEVTVVEPVGDVPYLRPGDYVALRRNVEMYAWIEEKKGGSKSRDDHPRREDYEYRREWTNQPPDSSAFAFPTGHENPPAAIPAATFVAPEVRLGDVLLDGRGLDLPSYTPLTLRREIVFPEDGFRLEGSALFVGKGTTTQPRIGDLRITYSVVPAGARATVFGVKQGEALVPYLHRGRHRLYRLFYASREDALERMGREYRSLLWGFRIGGLLLIWIGFLMALSPLTSLLSYVPVLGGLGKGVAAFVTFVLAALIAVVVMMISYLFHNLLILAILVILLAMAGAVVHAVIRQRAQEAADSTG